MAKPTDLRTTLEGLLIGPPKDITIAELPKVLRVHKEKDIILPAGYEDEIFLNDEHIKDPLERAFAFAKRKKGQLYTQVDCEGTRTYRDFAYVKGGAWVNRTGVYMVVWRKK